MSPNKFQLSLIPIVTKKISFYSDEAKSSSVSLCVFDWLLIVVERCVKHLGSWRHLHCPPFPHWFLVIFLLWDSNTRCFSLTHCLTWQRWLQTSPDLGSTPASISTATVTWNVTVCTCRLASKISCSFFNHCTPLILFDISTHPSTRATLVELLSLTIFWILARSLSRTVGTFISSSLKLFHVLRWLSSVDSVFSFFFFGWLSRIRSIPLLKDSTQRFLVMKEYSSCLLFIKSINSSSNCFLFNIVLGAKFRLALRSEVEAFICRRSLDYHGLRS